MNQRVILCLDDDPSVLAQIERELSRFNELFDIICATSAGAANEILESLQAADRRVALFICDHTLGEDEGINLLINIDNHPASHGARTVLMNDQPDLEKIMQAVNEAVSTTA